MSCPSRQWLFVSVSPGAGNRLQRTCAGTVVCSMKKNHCHCANLIGPDIRDKWIDPNNLQFVGPHRKIKADKGVLDRLHELDEISRVVILFRSYPEVETPKESIVSIVQRLMNSKAYEILNYSDQ